MSNGSESSVNQKQGVINKCPQCGGPLKAFAAVCELCGHELAGVGANKTIEKIVLRFQEIEGEAAATGATGKDLDAEVTSRKARFIRDLPIPNSREDLLSLIHYIRPKIEDGIKPDPNAEEWKMKFKEVMSLAKNAYKGDAKTRAEFEEIERSLQITISTALKARAKRSPLVVIGVALVILFVVAGIVSIQVGKRKVAQCEETFAQDSAAEKSRLDRLFAKANAELKEKKYSDANATLAELRWEYTAACKKDTVDQMKAQWDKNRNGLEALVRKAEMQVAQQKQAEVDRATAESEAAVRNAVTEIRKAATNKEW